MKYDALHWFFFLTFNMTGVRPFTQEAILSLIIFSENLEEFANSSQKVQVKSAGCILFHSPLSVQQTPSLVHTTHSHSSSQLLHQTCSVVPV